MRVVIPACGRGERFKREGYETIKPKIPIAGEPMLDAAVLAAAQAVGGARDLDLDRRPGIPSQQLTDLA